jgi:copper homeostasis protein
VCLDPFAALEELISAGVDRVLTSGQKRNGVEGSELIGKLVEHAAGRISIMACGGLNETNLAAVIAKTGAGEFHFTAFENAVSEMTFRNDAVAMGSEHTGSEYVRQITTAPRVRSIIESAK